MVYPTLSHSILLLLGLLAASLLIFSISVALTTIERDLTKAELNFIADSAKNKILEVYSLANQTSNYTYGIFNLSLPEKIGNKKYSIALSQNSLFLNTSVKNQLIETSRYLAIDAELNGISFIPASIKIEKENEKIKIELIK